MGGILLRTWNRKISGFNLLSKRSLANRREWNSPRMEEVSWRWKSEIIHLMKNGVKRGGYVDQGGCGITVIGRIRLCSCLPT